MIMVLYTWYTLLAVAVGLPAGSVAVLWFFYPAGLFILIEKLRTLKCGLKVRYISTGDGTFRYCYAERGHPSSESDSMLWLHGYSANKGMFLNVIEKLPKDIHVVLLDLPGHGDTTCPDISDDVDMNIIMEKVHEFVTLVGLDKRNFHLLGTSMGGAISMLYAGKYHDEVSRLTIMCPAMRTPIMTKFLEETYEGKNRLLPQTEEELQYMLDMCSYHKIRVPRQMLKGVLHIRKPNSGFWKKVFESFTSKEEELTKLMEERSQNVTMPTHVIWGENDEVMHVSGVEMLREKLPNCVRVDIIERCGHTCVMDRPGKVTKCLLQFRNQLPKKYQ